ncbi:MAG TPA: hypothetical protein VHO70_04445 [Chitinispirillaceae bacterium]|nr:hypothetical protein [Chitinispirillaceae bacterium]
MMGQLFRVRRSLHRSGAISLPRRIAGTMIALELHIARNGGHYTTGTR